MPKAPPFRCPEPDCKNKRKAEKRADLGIFIPKAIAESAPPAELGHVYNDGLEADAQGIAEKEIVALHGLRGMGNEAEGWCLPQREPISQS
jgi:hypothetical protein